MKPGHVNYEVTAKNNKQNQHPRAIAICTCIKEKSNDGRGRNEGGREILRHSKKSRKSTAILCEGSVVVGDLHAIIEFLLCHTRFQGNASNIVIMLNGNTW